MIETIDERADVILPAGVENERMLTRREAAVFLRVGYPTLERWAMRGVGPLCIKIGPRRVAYPLPELRNFVAHQVQQRRGQQSRTQAA